MQRFVGILSSYYCAHLLIRVFFPLPTPMVSGVSVSIVEENNGGGRTNPSRCQEFVKPRSKRLKCKNFTKGKHYSKRKHRLSSRAKKQNNTIARSISVKVFMGR